MIWAIYWPVLLVLAAAVVAGVVYLVRRLRGTDENPFIETERKPPEDRW